MGEKISIRYSFQPKLIIDLLVMGECWLLWNFLTIICQFFKILWDFENFLNTVGRNVEMLLEATSHTVFMQIQQNFMPILWQWGTLAVAVLSDLSQWYQRNLVVWKIKHGINGKSYKRSKDLGALLDSCSWDDIGNLLEACIKNSLVQTKSGFTLRQYLSTSLYMYQF